MDPHTHDRIGLILGVIALTGLVGYYAYVVMLEGRVTALLSSAIGDVNVTVCGNGKIEGGEKCDDGNTYALDGCTNCGIEAGYLCINEPSVCGPFDGFASSASASSMSSTGSSVSSLSSTGSSLSSSESSSLSSSSSSDSSNSSISSFLSASSAASSASIQRNLRRMLHEEPEGPSAASSQPAAAAPAPSSASYIKPFCGDGNIINEECDDENAASGDGCSATCTVESGYICKGAPSGCFIACGDGIVMGSEKCDDGGNNNGDGCSAVCTIESSYSCTGSPSNCTKLSYCGDGVKEGSEACDDGNSDAGDGCTPACTFE